jgi:hypothetical protein
MLSMVSSEQKESMFGLPDPKTIRTMEADIFKAMEGAKWYQPSPSRQALLMAGPPDRRVLLPPTSPWIEYSNLVDCYQTPVGIALLAADWDAYVPRYAGDKATALALLQKVAAKGYPLYHADFAFAESNWAKELQLLWVSIGYAHSGAYASGESPVSLAQAITSAVHQVITWALAVYPEANGLLPEAATIDAFIAQKERGL